ncbi:aa3-type cytochrome c oxidase subunit IV [Aquamicrobium segne]|uniref:Aa3-type cytochrome c oxidase subunit IV n=1 Tax=Aquamicrobium segne TaxID=469547 RepID=A0ABW0GXD9_9HYPH
MADHPPTGPVELGAQMDYAEHEKTYNLFTKLTKYSTLICIAILIGMAFGFFVGGTVSGFIVAVLAFIGSAYLLR